MKDSIYNMVMLNTLHAKSAEQREKGETALQNQFEKAGVQVNVKELYNMSVEDFIKTNANEAMSTGQAGFGQEFVEDEILDTMLLERLEDPTSLFSVIPGTNIKRMQGKTVTLPARGKKIRMIGGVENSDIPANVSAQIKKARTTELQLSVKKLVLTIPYTDELLEDSVIGLAAYVLSELSAAFDTSMHEVILNGDTTTGNLVNINIIDGNTSGAATDEVPDGERSDVISINQGARKVALDLNATVNAGVFELSDIRAARSKMGIKGVNPENLIMVVSNDVYFQLLGLSQVETIERFGDAATVVNGRITAIDGMRIMNREELRNATATGEISATPANNTTGQAVIIHLPSLWVGIRRQFGTEVDRNVKEQQTEVTGYARVDVVFNNLQTNTKATSPVALIHNITL